MGRSVKAGGRRKVLTEEQQAEEDALQKRREEAWKLKCSGYSYREIGRAVGISHVMAREYVLYMAEELEAASLGRSELQRRQALSQLDAALKAIWSDVLVGDHFAIDRLLKIIKEKAKLQGLYAPTKIDITSRIRDAARAAGLDPEEAVAEAERIARNINGR